jgi:hypothetical protein
VSTYLGELGEATEPNDVTFDYFDARSLRVHPDFCELDLLDFVEATAAIDEDSPQAMTAVKDFFRSVIHPDDFDLFWRTAKGNRQGVKKLMRTIWTIVETISGRPTTQPSDSSGGPSTTAPTSTGGSSSTERAMQHLRGRADLQLAVVQAQRAQVAA